MELWIRSQDKIRLVKIKDIRLIMLDNKEIIGNYHLIALFQNDYKRLGINDYIRLGTYKSKERALEVLDEIQRHLVIFNDKNDNLFYVYEMPKE